MEPILTPSGVTGLEGEVGSGELEVDSLDEFEIPEEQQLEESGESEEQETSSTSEDSEIIDEIDDEDIEPLEFFYAETEGEAEPEPALEPDVEPDSELELELEVTTLVTDLDSETEAREEIESEPEPEPFTYNSTNGVFTVGETGKVNLDYLIDGGKYAKGEIGIFSLEGMEDYEGDAEAWERAAVRRALSNSTLGNLGIADGEEGAKFTGILDGELKDWNRGEYQFVDSFSMKPGEQFALVISAKTPIEQAFEAGKPLFFSNDTTYENFADVTGDGHTFTVEDWRDGDYNDVVFQVNGARGEAVTLDEVIDPEAEDWRNSEVGQQVLDYIAPVEFDSGVFTVDNSGEVGIDFLYDGGKWKGELAVFSLEGLEEINPNSGAFIEEAASRALSNSELGHVIISDRTEGARFDGVLGDEGQDWNSGDYRGVKTFAMNPGDRFGMMLLPKHSVSKLADNPALGGLGAPLFSMSSLNPEDAYHLGQLADVTGDGNTFVMEDWRVDHHGSDTDYNDLIFQVRGATANAVNLDEVINPEYDWRESDLGKGLLAYAKPYVTPETPELGEIIPEEVYEAIAEVRAQEALELAELEAEEEVEEAISPTPETPETPVASESVEPEVVETQEEAAPTPEAPEASELTATLPTTLINDLIKDLGQEFEGVDNQGKANLDNLDTDLSDIEAATQAKIDRLDGEFAEVLGELEDFTDQTNDNLSELEDELHQSRKQTGDKVTGISQTLSTNHQALVKQVAKLEGDIASSVRSAESDMNRAIADLDRQTEDVRQQIERKELGDREDEIKQQYQRLQQQKDKIVSDYQSQVRSLKSLKNQISSTAQSQLNALQTNSNQSISGAQNYLRSIQQELNSIEASYQQLEASQTQVAEQAQDRMDQLETLRNQEFQQSQNELETLTDEWNAWLDDANMQTEVWQKIFSDPEPWYNTQEPLPKAGTPLVGVIDTGFAPEVNTFSNSEVLLGKDWIENDFNPLLNPGEGNPHGTDIVEVIAGIDPESQLWLGRAVGSNEWSKSLIEFVDQVRETQQPNAVVNLSFDLTETDANGVVSTRYELTPLERSALTYAQQNNVLIVTAAGNQGDSLSALGQATKEFDNILVVGAAEDWERSAYSSYNDVEYDYYGKGVDLLAQGTAKNGASGTSVSTAKVTGAASLVWSANPDLNYTQVRDILKNTATDLNTPGWDAQTGLGLLNIPAAVYIAKEAEAQVYKPSNYELVTDILKSHDVPKVHWPEFYQFSYYETLQSQLTGVTWTNDLAIPTERATSEWAWHESHNIQEVGEHWRREYGYQLGRPNGEKARGDGNRITADHNSQLSGDELKYVRYWMVDDRKTNVVGIHGTIRVIREINHTLKAKWENIQHNQQKLASQFENLTEEYEEQKHKQEEKITQDREEIEKKEQKIKDLLDSGSDAQSEEIRQLKKEIEQLKKDLQEYTVQSQQELAELQTQIQEKAVELKEINEEIEVINQEAKRQNEQRVQESRQAAASYKKSFWEKVTDSVAGFIEDIGEGIKSTLDAIDVETVLDLLKRIPLVGTAVSALEGLYHLANGDWIEVLKAAIDGALDLTPAGSIISSTMIDIFVEVAWALKDKDYKGAISATLSNFNVNKTVADTLVNVAWSMKDGDWKSIFKAGLDGAGFENGDKFIDIAWDVIDGDYKGALGTGLTFAGFGQQKANTLIDIAWNMADNRYGKALKTGLNYAGFSNSNSLVDLAFDLKDGDYESALKTAFNASGLGAGKTWVDVAFDLKDGNYKSALETGLKTAGFSQYQDFIDTAWDLKEGNYKNAFIQALNAAGLENATALGQALFDDYSYPSDPEIPLAAIPAHHKGYEYLARSTAYEDGSISATPERALDNSSPGGNKLTVGERVNGGYTVDYVIDDRSTGFYAVGLIPDDPTQPPVLSVRGTGGSPTDEKYGTLIDVIEDTNPDGIGYGQFSAHQAEIQAWLAAQTQPVDLVGHSLGGALAQTIAAHFPTEVGEVVTFNSPGIDSDTAELFVTQGGNPNSATHYITSGDLVSMAGEKYLPGRAVLASYPNLNVFKKHSLSVLGSNAIQSENQASEVKLTALSVDELNSPSFGYGDRDYTLFRSILSLVSPPVATALATRGTTETSRQAIGSVLHGAIDTVENWIDVAKSIQSEDYLNALKESLGLTSFSLATEWGNMMEAIDQRKYIETLTQALTTTELPDGDDWLNLIGQIDNNQYTEALTTGFKLADFGATETWIDIAQHIEGGEYLDALSKGFEATGFTDATPWISMVRDVGNGNYLNALRTGFNLTDFEAGQSWVDMAWNIQEGNYLRALRTGFDLAGFDEGKHAINAGLALKNGDYFKAFTSGISMIDGVDDLVDALTYLKDGKVKEAIPSMIDAAKLLKVFL
ncbi:DUF4114 domain-containing protein [Roseofilum capinflatum]|uniref:DUF4114 domain-containing protein n=1 Tax=Roseofilum capinflatum BLCC-M114 TaxID=3022440 RepID=A0ABT7BBT2_9CYAN|nr:DUF4114 domain-containing protein [Roseofilum capinflatum]MDJ1176257.1 DUF4114 domain-containing protein [Roseofilum capinflatum BLCC-M114]